jgi:hypothetical protein
MTALALFALGIPLIFAFAVPGGMMFRTLFGRLNGADAAGVAGAVAAAATGTGAAFGRRPGAPSAVCRGSAKIL